MNDGSVVDSLVNGNGGVNGGGSDGLSLNDRLDGLVNVVVNVLVGDGGSGTLVSNGTRDGLSVDVSLSLLLELLSVLREHVVLGLPYGLGEDVEFLLGRKNLLVLDGLDSVLVVVDVSLSVNGLNLLDSLVRSDVLLDDLGGGLRADLGGVALVGGRKEAC